MSAGSLHDFQQRFTAHLRQPHAHPPPDNLPAARLAVYRELLLNNLDSFLGNNFPVIKRILSATQWQNLIAAFFAEHRCHTPVFAEIPEEFLAYLHSAPALLHDYPPFLLELAHYEWVEMALAIAQDTLPPRDAAFIADPCAYPVRLSPLAWPLAYHYPVHRIAPDFQPQISNDEPVCLVVYRDECGEVRFLAITPAIFQLLHLVHEHPGLTPAQLWERWWSAADLSFNSPQVVALWRELAAKRIILAKDT